MKPQFFLKPFKNSLLDLSSLVLKVPYQLRRTAGPSGAIWGNVANATGNGITGSGTGTSTSQTVYVTVPSTDFMPDQYTDTVTITINY